jgi:hypothetical protein
MVGMTNHILAKDAVIVSGVEQMAMPDSEATVYEDFRHHGLTVIGAIERLEKFGYSSREAEEVVDEWISMLEEIESNTRE